MATLHKYRPDIVPDSPPHAKPLPEIDPNQQQQQQISSNKPTATTTRRGKDSNNIENENEEESTRSTEINENLERIPIFPSREEQQAFELFQNIYGMYIHILHSIFPFPLLSSSLLFSSYVYVYVVVVDHIQVLE